MNWKWIVGGLLLTSVTVIISAGLLVSYSTSTFLEGMEIGAGVLALALIAAVSGLMIAKGVVGE